MSKQKRLIPVVGIVIIAVTVLINLLPYYLIKYNPALYLNVALTSSALFYGIFALQYGMLGTVISSIVGNKKTGLLTFAFSGIVFTLENDIAAVFICAAVAVIGTVIYGRTKIGRIVRCIIIVPAFAAVVCLIAFGMKEVSYSNIAAMWLALDVAVLYIIFVAISVFFEKIKLFSVFDEDSTDLDKNYRVRSINDKLMIVLNVICVIMIIAFSVLSILLLSQKETERKTAEESVWEVVLYNAISEDADIYADRDYSKIEAEGEKMAAALNIGQINCPAYILITTNIDGEFIRQVYVANRNWESEYNYSVTYNGEYILTKDQVNSIPLLPAEGDSALFIYEQSKFLENSIAAVERILALAFILMVFMNIFAEMFIRKNIVRPINQMTTETLEFAYRDKNEEVDITYEDENVFFKNRVEINSGDEIESLSRAFHKNMDDVEEYIKSVNDKSKQLSDMQHNIIITMADIIESRDLNTGGHIKRTATYVGIVTKRLMKNGMFSDILSQDYLDDMIVAAPLHDMGKIHVPDHILNKNGRLTEEEFGIMKTHAEVGKELLEDASDSLGEFKYLIIAKQMAEGHHEWYNGNGYPHKLAGEEIPLCARIMAVADVFDALVSKRVYKDPMDLDTAFGIIEKETGTHFDPIVGKTFLECRPELEAALAEFNK